eukprot:gene30727-35763_t
MSKSKSIMLAAGARRVVLPEGAAERGSSPAMEFSFDSVEMLAVLMNGLQSQGKCPLPLPLWKEARPTLAAMLLSGDCLKSLGPGEVEAYRKAQLDSMCLGIDKAGLVLRRLVDAHPTPRKRRNRPGFEAEDWASQALRLCASEQDWDLYSSASRTDMAWTKGVKGEADALLMDSSNLCQGVVEIKIGGTSPFNALYNDLGKLKRMLHSVRGGSATFSAHCCASPAPKSAVKVNFSVGVTPVYLSVTDEDVDLGGREALDQAEAQLLKIGVSQALSSTAAWARGTAELIELDSTTARVLVQGGLVGAMRARTSPGFFRALSGCEVYQMTKPPDEVMEGSGLVRDDGAVKNADLSWEEIQELGEAKAKTKRASTVAAYESRLRKIKVCSSFEF